MVKKRLVARLIVFIMLVTSSLLPVHAINDCIDSNTNNYVGPGKHETKLYIKNAPKKVGDKELTDVGKVAMWNTREKFYINIEVENNWNITEVNIYVGSEQIPTSIGGSPKIKAFPYRDCLLDSTNFYELELDLYDDLNFTWGKRDKGKRIQNVSVFVKLEDDGEQSAHKEACAYGENEFDSKWGWWTLYAMDHPKTGHFIDSPVGGMKFATPTNKGHTDDSGAFDYIEGEKVTLSFGNINLGTTTAKHKISPLDIVGTNDLDDIRVINMARLLQSLDSDADPKRGITITEPVTSSLEKVMNELNIEELDFSDSDSIDDIIVGTVELVKEEEGIELKVVSSDEARENLEKGTSSNMFRKNVSKTPEFINTKAKLELMPVYVPAKKANGDPVTLNYYDSVYDEETDTYTEVLSETRDIAKPLVVVYTDEVEDTGASDVFAAVSRDEGSTWQRKNLSKSAEKSSFKLKNGTDYPGDVRKPQVKVRGNYILVAWTSKYAKTGKPTYAIKINDDPESEKHYPYDDPYWEEDIWGVSGPQRSVDYTDEGHPEVGEIPYSVVWTCRGVIDPETGDITWYKPERLTSGRRDAFQLMFIGAPDVGFALVWQEDPEGLRPGEQAGPGEGWSGATTNHKTDIWYSYVLWDDFKTIDENFVSKGSSQKTETEDELEDEEIKGRPKVLVPFSLPVRISDNDTVNIDNMKAEYSEITEEDLSNMTEGETIAVEGGEWIPIISDESGNPGNNGKSSDNEAELLDIDSKSSDNSGGSSQDDEKLRGTHQYGYRIEGLCDQLYYKVNHQGADKYVAVTEDGRLLDGNTGASRPNIMIQPYTKKDGTKSGWVVICYEETKGLGAGPPDKEDSNTDDNNQSEAIPTVIELNDEHNEDDGSFTSFSTYGDLKNASEILYKEASSKDGSNSDSGEGSGEQRGKLTYVPDMGKNVIYHTFDIQNPDLVSAGNIINPQVKGIEGEPGEIEGLQYLVDEEGNLIYDWQGDPIPSYENARRPRLLIQSKKNAIEGKADDEKGTVLVMVYKMGEEGKGRPSDIFMRRWEVCKNDKGNPYSCKYMVKNENKNISSVTVGDTWVNEDRNENSKGEGIKVLNWTQTEENYSDTSWLNPYDDARAHRGILRGDKLAIAYNWTPNWASARNGNDVYNVYVRRSFDGGKTFTTNPEGTNEIYIDGEYQGIGVLHTDTFKTSDTKETHEKITIETFYPAGGFEPARNLSQLQNTKTSVIEPRLVGGPSTIKTDDPTTEVVDLKPLYSQDIRDINSFWVTYGTESNPGKNSAEPGGPLDLYYSYTKDFGDSYYTETKTIKADSKGNHAGEEKVVWDWLAKDTGQKKAAQAECQIRMTPDGTIFYSVWNETGENDSDVMFRRIMREGGSIEASITTEDITGPIIRIFGVNDGDVKSNDVTIDISLNEEGAWNAELYKDDDDSFTAIDSNNVPYTIVANNERHIYTLKIKAEDNLVNTSYKEISFTIDGTVPQITVVGVSDNELSSDDKTITITATGDTTTLSLTKNGEIFPFSSGDTLSEDGAYNLTVNSTNTEYNSTATEIINFTIDKVAPEIAISGVSNDTSYTNAVKPVINVTDNHSLIQNIEMTTKLNGEAFESGNTVKNKGTYTLDVTAKDEAGNEAKVVYTFTIVSSSKEDGPEEDSSEEPSETLEQTEMTINNNQTTQITTKDGKLKITIPALSTPEDATIILTYVEDGLEPALGMVKIGNIFYRLEMKDKNGNNISNFNKNIKVEFYYNDTDIPSGTKENDIKVCYWDEKLEMWIAIPTEVDALANKITGTTKKLAEFITMSMPNIPSLKDIKGHWAEIEIYKVISMKIASGNPDGTFRPEEKISREEFAKMIVLAAGLKPTINAKLTFEDADKISNWAKGYVATAVDVGLMSSFENNFMPKNNIPRGDLVMMVVKALKQQMFEQSNIMFKDKNKISTFALPFIAKAVHENIIYGYPDGTFKSNYYVTRAESAAIISRFVK